MGKYMRKAKASGDVAVMEVGSAPLGVRTRARALALQRLQKQQQAQGGDEGEKEEGAAGEYLELRSRTLEKLPPAPAAVRRCGGRKAAEAAAAAQEEAEASFGENVLELEAMARSTRQTTPCSLIRDSETISTPGSTTRPGHSNSHRRVQARVLISIPSSAQLNEFFAADERKEQQAFMDKYNFDPVNECPLPGRYEWVKLD